MRLSYRSARASEFAGCFDRLCEPFAYPSDLRPLVPSVWARWLADRVMTAHMIEQHHDNGTVTIAGMGACVFVHEAFITDALRRGKPYVRAELVRRAIAGEHVVLTLDEMRAAQRGDGLTLLFVCDPAAPTDLTEEEKLLVDAKWSEALYELRGCNIRSMWHEVYSEHAMRRSEGCGQIATPAWPAPAELPRDAAQRPFLMGLTREQAKEKPGTHASFLFMHVSPQFDFTARQQELLQEALQGATDDELAGQLKVSPSAVKKRWISVYDRVSAAMPGWLEGTAEHADARGTEKRRHLLNYLRQHPEELHPACASRD